MSSKLTYCGRGGSAGIQILNACIHTRVQSSWMHQSTALVRGRGPLSECSLHLRQGKRKHLWKPARKRMYSTSSPPNSFSSSPFSRLSWKVRVTIISARTFLFRYRRLIQTWALLSTFLTIPFYLFDSLRHDLIPKNRDESSEQKWIRDYVSNYIETYRNEIEEQLVWMVLESESTPLLGEEGFVQGQKQVGSLNSSSGDGNDGSNLRRIVLQARSRGGNGGEQSSHSRTSKSTLNLAPNSSVSSGDALSTPLQRSEQNESSSGTLSWILWGWWWNLLFRPAKRTEPEMELQVEWHFKKRDLLQHNVQHWDFFSSHPLLYFFSKYTDKFNRIASMAFTNWIFHHAHVVTLTDKKSQRKFPVDLIAYVEDVNGRILIREIEFRPLNKHLKNQIVFTMRNPAEIGSPRYSSQKYLNLGFPIIAMSPVSDSILSYYGANMSKFVRDLIDKNQEHYENYAARTQEEAMNYAIKKFDARTNLP